MDRAVTTCRLPLYAMGLGANKGILRPKHHVYAVNYYSRVSATRTDNYPVNEWEQKNNFN